MTCTQYEDNKFTSNVLKQRC